MTKYLYGASVQGIQSYIFSTDKLQHIIGASELVERVCTEEFREMLKEHSCNYQIVVEAAGNVKCIFDSKTDCERVVHDFPKRIADIAPGITISQAVVRMEDNNFADSVDELERRLMTQRNRPTKSLTLGLMAIERSRKTGLPAVEMTDGEFIDDVTKHKIDAVADNEATLHLMEKLTGQEVRIRQVPMDISDMTGGNSWIAVIHADGNGLGEVVARVGKNPNQLHDFSTNLDKATKAAAQEAYQKTVTESGKLPMRAVVLSGDDLTVICRADIAVDFVQCFLAAFEKQTEQLIGNKLTACAGIAFIKSSYPFHYGYQLAETLCAQAKCDAKSPEMKRGGLAPSCLMFHKVQSSFVEDWTEIAKKELTAADGSSYQFGPYYLDNQASRWTICDIMNAVNRLTKDKDGNAAKTDIREWLTLMADNPGLAHQKVERVKAIASPAIKQSFTEAIKPVERNGKKHYPAYDILSLVAIRN